MMPHELSRWKRMRLYFKSKRHLQLACEQLEEQVRLAREERDHLEVLFKNQRQAAKERA